MGYVLVWGQMSFWAATVITNLFSAIPGVGDTIVTWLWGGYAVGNPTLNRFFSLHYLLPFMIAGVVILHIWALHVSGQNNPMGIEPKSKKDTVPFTPYATVKDAFAVCLFLLLYASFVFFNPDALGHADNYIPANPLATPTHIVPEWYFLPFYAILRAVPNKLMGVILMFGAIASMFVLPWLDTSKVRSMRFRPAMRLYFILFVVACIVLGFCGAHPPDEFAIPIGEGGITWVWVSRIATAYYFAFFWLVMPFLPLSEKTSPVPDTISSPVLSHPATQPDGAVAAPQKD
jgi:ubiquinol-cytochrome c reductase cytochrome b subunit